VFFRFVHEFQGWVAFDAADFIGRLGIDIQVLHKAEPATASSTGRPLFTWRILFELGNWVAGVQPRYILVVNPLI